MNFTFSNIYQFSIFVKVTCGLCDTTMLYKEYIETHKATHYNLCWIDKDEKVVS
jgi:hypothetical protein